MKNGAGFRAIELFGIMHTKRLLVAALLVSLAATSQEHRYYYTFFTNSRMSGEYFFSEMRTNAATTGSQQNRRLMVSQSVFHTPGNSLQLEYKNEAGANWQAFLYKPEIRGQDHFSKAAYLSFWVYRTSANTNDKSLPVVQLMLRDSSLTNSYSFRLTKTNAWEQVLIPSSSFKKFDPQKPGQALGVVFSQRKSAARGTHKLYLDDIEFVPANTRADITARPGIDSVAAYAKHVNITWEAPKDPAIRLVKIYRSGNGTDYSPVGIQYPFIRRYTDFTGETGKTYQYKISFIDQAYRESELSAPVSASTREMSDDELLTMVQEAAFWYYWDGAEPNSGLAKENIAGRHSMIASGASGFGILALIAAIERKFITREQSIQRFSRIVGFLDSADVFHGAFAHFIDGNTGKAVPYFGERDNGGDLVETSFLIQGLLAARAYFKGNDARERKIRETITRIWESVEWNWYRQHSDSKFLYWHWSPDQGWIINHRLIGWNETMVTYLLAIASPTHSIPASMYYTGWASQDSIAQEYRAGWGGTREGAMYTNGNKYYDIPLDVGVSNGGPLFFTHYSYLGYDPKQLNDEYTNYFVNNQKIARINYLYCVDNPGNYKGYGDSCWGLTASDGPYNYSADEPVLRQDRGKIAPTGAISSFPYTPVESMKALKNFYHNYGHFLWGEYGFRDAFNLGQNWCSEIFMGLNQAPMTVMIENYRTGLLWKLFMSDKDVQNGLSKLAAETNK